MTAADSQDEKECKIWPKFFKFFEKLIKKAIAVASLSQQIIFLKIQQMLKELLMELEELLSMQFGEQFYKTMLLLTVLKSLQRLPTKNARK